MCEAFSTVVSNRQVFSYLGFIIFS